MIWTSNNVGIKIVYEFSL